MGMGKFISCGVVGEQVLPKTIEGICKGSFYYVYSKYQKY